MLSAKTLASLRSDFSGRNNPDLPVDLSGIGRLIHGDGNPVWLVGFLAKCAGSLIKNLEGSQKVLPGTLIKDQQK